MSTGDRADQRLTGEDLPRLPAWLVWPCLAVFLLLAIVAQGSSVLAGDETVLDAIQALPATPGRILWDTFNLLGDTEAGPVALIVLVAIAVRRGQWQFLPFFLVLALLRLAAYGVKPILDSPRPTANLAELRSHHDSLLGYPSGHALTATIVVGACALVLLRCWGRTPAVIGVIALLTIWAIGCCMARVWYGAHWPTDIAGGITLGIVSLGASLELGRVLATPRSLRGHALASRRGD